MGGTLYIISVWLHVLAASVWIGGMAFLVLVVVPVMRRGTLKDAGARFILETGLRFRSVGWVALAVLFATGWYNMSVRGIAWGDFFTSQGLSNPIVSALGIKVALYVVVLAVSLVHDFYIGPQATELWQREGDSPAATKMRKKASKMGRWNALLALLIILFAVMVVRGGLP